MGPTLDELKQAEADAYEAFAQAFIRHTTARNAVQRKLAELREGHQTLFDT